MDILQDEKLDRVLRLMQEDIDIREGEIAQIIYRMDDMIYHLTTMDEISPLFKLIIDEMVLLIPKGIMRDVFIEFCYSDNITEIACKNNLSLDKTCSLYEDAIRLLKTKHGFLTKYLMMIPYTNDRSNISGLLSKDLEYDLGLSRRAVNCLHGIGLRTVEDLLRFLKNFGLKKLTKQRYLGNKTLEEIKDALIAQGMMDEDEKSYLFQFIS